MSDFNEGDRVRHTYDSAKGTVTGLTAYVAGHEYLDAWFVDWDDKSLNILGTAYSADQIEKI